MAISDDEWFAMPKEKQWEIWKKLPQSEQDRFTNLELKKKREEDKAKQRKEQDRIAELVARLEKNGEKVQQTAFKRKSGKIIESGTYHNLALLPGGFTQSDVSGFLTNKGTFLTREEAGAFVEGGGLYTGEKHARNRAGS